jgi:hypothetical protein
MRQAEPSEITSPTPALNTPKNYCAPRTSSAPMWPFNVAITTRIISALSLEKTAECPRINSAYQPKSNPGIRKIPLGLKKVTAQTYPIKAEISSKLSVIGAESPDNTQFRGFSPLTPAGALPRVPGKGGRGDGIGEQLLNKFQNQ